MTALRIPSKLPHHTKTWLRFLDAAMAERALAAFGSEDADARLKQARWQKGHATGNTYYFLSLYEEALTAQAERRNERIA